MLTLSLSRSDCKKIAQQTGDVIHIGNGFIEKFPSNHLMMSMVASKRGSRVWVGESEDPFAFESSLENVVDKCRSLNQFEGISVIADASGNPGAIEIARTGAGSSPIYVAAADESLVLSWKFEVAASGLAKKVPNREACRIFLQHNAALVREQILEGMYMLWPGESLVFDQEGLRFRCADEMTIALPNTVRDGAHVAREFIQIIGEELSRTLLRSDNALIELSGGLDSSCVAVAAFSVKSSINTYGLIHNGAVGRQQSNRRSEIVNLLRAVDFEYPSTLHDPLMALDVDECSVTPYDDNHRLSCVSAVDAHPSGIPDLVITGIGGDELTMENTHLREGHELPGGICSSGLVAACARADMFMRRGIWPSNPLLSHAVVDFCRALPSVYRKGRMLNVLSLARSGLSDGFIFPRYSEHYGPSMQWEAAMYDYDAALRQSVIADFSIVDFSQILQKARNATYGGFSYKLIGELYNLLRLERVLRRYVR